jgi:hypothetical protein
MINADTEDPINPSLEIGYYKYSAFNIDSNITYSDIDLNTVLTTGNYTIYAQLFVTNISYKNSIVTITKSLKIVPGKLNVTWYNPKSISHTVALSNTQLNATSNSNPSITNFTYTPPNGTILPIGNKQKLNVLINTTDQGFLYKSIKYNCYINIS